MALLANAMSLTLRRSLLENLSQQVRIEMFQDCAKVDRSKLFVSGVSNFIRQRKKEIKRGKLESIGKIII